MRHKKREKCLGKFNKVFALAVTHKRGAGKEECPIKVETIPIGCQLDGSGSRVSLVLQIVV